MKVTTMILITVIDNRGGMSFNGRPLSQDIRLRERILRITSGSTLWMDPDSRRRFGALGGGSIRPDPAYLHKAGAGEYCFVVKEDLAPFVSKAEGLILFHWNRDYPSDHRLDLDMHQWTLRSTYEFQGNSHPKITEERYEKKH